MAKSTPQSIPNGDMRTLRHSRRQDGNSANLPKTNNKKSAKRSISHKPRTRHAESQLTGDDGQGDDDDGDGGNTAEPPTTAEEPAVSTLPGVSPLVVGEDSPRLAGLTMKNDDIPNDETMLDESHVSADAGLDGNHSEDDYAGVENVSESDASEDEDDEEAILRSAEQDLIDEFERTEQRLNADVMAMDLHGMAIEDDDIFSRHLNLQHTSGGVDEFGFPINMNDDPFHGLATEDTVYRDLWEEAESAIWRMPESARNRDDNDPNSTQKRVRFEETEVADSASSSSDDPDDAFPDLFTAVDDASVKRHLALNLDQSFDLDRIADDAESFYDFEDEDEKFAFEVDEESDSDCDSSTYDSDDDGDATDEESREEQIARLEERKKAAGRPSNSRPSTPVMANRAISTMSTPSTSRPNTPKSTKGPRTGTFAIDPTRAAITTDSEGRKIKVLPPSQPAEKDKAFWQRARTANSSRTNTPPNSAYLTMPSPVADDMPSRPFTAKSTLGSMFNGDLDILRNNDASGIAEALFPDMLTSRSTSITATPTDDSETDRQTDINMQDFLAMDDDSGSESDGPSSTPSGQNVFVPRESFSTDLLDHFDRSQGVVGSFRRNQHQARHFSSLASHPAKRASTHEFNALQKGKRGAANTPMTPARKNRISQDLSSISAGVRKSISSPLSSRRPRSRGNSLAGISQANLYQTLARNPFD